MTALILLAGIWIILGLVAFGSALNDMTDHEKTNLELSVFFMCVVLGPTAFGGMLHDLFKKRGD